MPNAKQLRAEADALYARIADLRRQADLIEQRAKSRAAQATRDRALREAAMQAERGASDDELVARLAPLLNGNTSDARLALSEQRRKYKRALKAQRNREIMRLAWRGKTNAQIAARVGLAEKTVSRIVAKRLHRQVWK